MSRNCPYVVLAKAAVADLADLCDKARTASRKFTIKRSDQWVEVRSEGLAFHFEDHTAAILFAAYCARSKIEYFCRWPNQF
jgi:hypothetical protein